MEDGLEAKASVLQTKCLGLYHLIFLMLGLLPAVAAAAVVAAAASLCVANTVVAGALLVGPMLPVALIQLVC